MSADLYELSRAYQLALEAYRQRPEDDDLRDDRDKAKAALDCAWLEVKYGES